MQIENKWMEIAERGSLYYPAAGCDWKEFIETFRCHVSKYIFCDLHYPKRLKLNKISEKIADLKLLSSMITGVPDNELVNVKGYRELDPSWLIERYADQLNNRTLEVTRRRGFGQCGMLEQPSKSISVFVHRGDSPGESGSNTFYFRNAVANFPPLTHLFNSLCDRLTDECLIISDGSNVGKRFMNRWHRKSEITDAELLKCYSGKTWTFGNFEWRLVGRVSDNYGPTLVWGLTRYSSS